MKVFITRKTVFTFLLLTVSFIAGYAMAQPLEAKAREFQARLLKSNTRQETRPTMDPALYADPDIRWAYKAAREIPGILDKLFCYCYCEVLPMFGEKDLHKNLLTCFTNNHGSKCLTCVKEANEAMRLHGEGKKPDEIAKILADQYLSKALR